MAVDSRRDTPSSEITNRSLAVFSARLGAEAHPSRLFHAQEPAGVQSTEIPDRMIEGTGEPGSDSGMQWYDQVVLNGTARGYVIVSGMQQHNPCRNHPAFVPGKPANETQSPTSKRVAPSRPGSIHSLLLPVSPLPARWLILDSGIREDTTSVWRRVTLSSNVKPKSGHISLGNWSDSTGRRVMSSSLPDNFIC